MAFAYDDPGSNTESETNYAKTTPELTPSDLLVRVKEWWRIDYPNCRKWHKEAKLDFNFRAGEQWPEEDKRYMEDAQQRACLVFNQIDPVIDVVTGSEITNRQEVRYVPRQVGDAPVNETLTEAARWFRDECDAEFEESAAFADAATCGMGWTETRLDYEENPNGDPKIERIDPLEMVWDSIAKQANVKDARRLFRVRRKMPLNDAKAKWPRDIYGQPIEDDALYDAAWAGDIADQEVPYEVHYPGEPLKHESDEGHQERTVTIVHVQWFERQDYYRAMQPHPVTGQPQMAELNEQEHTLAQTRSAMLGRPYRAVKQVRKVYYSAFVGGEVLEVSKMQGPSGKPASAFTLNAMTAKWDRNNKQFYGLVRPMRGPQTWANKWLSTAVEIMARNAKGGLMLEEGAVEDIEQFEEQWALPGSNSFFQAGALTGGKVAPKPVSPFPQDFVGMSQFAVSNIRSVTGLNVEMLGLSGSNPDTPNDPKTASQEYQRRQSATIILAPLFDSLRRYRRVQGRVLLYLITEFLADGRLIRIVGQENDRYVPLIHDPNVLQYDVIVDDAPSAPSQKELVWNSLVTMLPMLQGMNPPPAVILTLLDYSPLPASLVAKIKQALAQAAATAPPPPPDPITLIMAEKKADVEASQQKHVADLQARQQEHAIDLQHENAKAMIDLRSRIAQEQIRCHGKAADIAIANGGPNPDPVAEGLIAGIKAGATRFATELMAGQLAQRANMPIGLPTHIGQIPGQPEAPRPVRSAGKGLGG